MGKFSSGNRRAAKLSGEDIIDIIESYKAGATQGELARRKGVTIGTIGRIVRGETHQQITRGQATSEGELRDGAAISLERLKVLNPALFEDQQAQERVAERFSSDLEKAVEVSNQLEELKNG